MQFSYTLDGKLRTGSQSERASKHIANETDFERFVESAQILDDTCGRWGAELSMSKTKWMHRSDSAVARHLPELEISGQIIERVHEFVYLGSLIADTYTLGVAEDVTRRVAEASKSFGRLKPIWKSAGLSKDIKRRLFIVCVSTVLLYGAENWALSSLASATIQNFY